MHFLRQRGRPLLVWLVLLCLTMLTGCSTTTALQQARWQHLGGDTSAAIETLSSADVVSANNRLLYYLEKGLLLHDNGDYQTSVKELLSASRLLNENDYISLRDEVKSVLANDWAGRYQGEYSERLWIHSYLMMNILVLGQYESAAVEARQALARIALHSDVLAKDHYTRALIALSFEAAGQLNDAYIEYRKLAIESNYPPELDLVLLPQARRLGFSNDVREIRERLKETQLYSDTDSTSTNNEIIIFAASGVIPQKISGSIFTDNDARLSFPQYYLPAASAPNLQIYIDDKLCKCQPVTTDFGSLVAASLDKRGLKTATKSVVRAVAKEAVADAIEDKDELAGELARLLFFALEEADTRSWQNLPRFLTIIRVPLTADAATQIDIRTSAADPASVKTFSFDPSQAASRFISMRLAPGQ